MTAEKEQRLTDAQLIAVVLIIFGISAIFGTVLNMPIPALVLAGIGVLILIYFRAFELEG
ncbi:MAG: hypothetical protein JRD89_08070 [Deltaproteobacteria bacterium]|nr:hypothetical protein [Deltaproteobacteria bacterium]